MYKFCIVYKRLKDKYCKANTMAKPIKATPDLVGKEANKFIKKMLEVEKSKITKKDRILALQIRNTHKKLLIC